MKNNLQKQEIQQDEEFFVTKTPEPYTYEQVEVVKADPRHEVYAKSTAASEYATTVNKTAPITREIYTQTVNKTEMLDSSFGEFISKSSSMSVWPITSVTEFLGILPEEMNPLYGLATVLQARAPYVNLPTVVVDTKYHGQEVSSKEISGQMLELTPHAATIKLPYVSGFVNDIQFIKNYLTGAIAASERKGFVEALMEAKAPADAPQEVTNVMHLQNDRIMLGLQSLIGFLPTQYQNGAVMLMSHKTGIKIHGLTDGQGRLLFPDLNSVYGVKNCYMTEIEDDLIIFANFKLGVLIAQMAGSEIFKMPDHTDFSRIALTLPFYSALTVIDHAAIVFGQIANA